MGSQAQSTAHLDGQDDPGTPVRPQVVPSITEQVGSVLKAAGAFAGSRFRVASEEERERRIAICQGCENFTGNRCALCGCYLGLKVASEVEACPIAKW